ncbi:MAG: DUF5667 domain-containing protein [Patescibacteria group bacterium]|nr:MAG: DUF5667 domain-containing protein [Patescibacteria group bacterium]
MLDKDFTKALSSLSATKPEKSWVDKNRELLSCQISNGEAFEAVKLGMGARFSLLFSRLSQPVPVAMMIVAFFALAGSAITFSKNSTPGDPLYMAKTAGERARLAATLSEREKAKLSINFAERRAIEMIELMNREEKNGEVIEGATQDPRMENLSRSFKQELSSARERLVKLEEKEAKQEAVGGLKPGINKNQELSVTGTATAVGSEEAKTLEGEKAEQGDGDVIIASEIAAAATVDASVKAALDEIENLFDSAQYAEAIEKLKNIKIQSSGQ